MDTDFSMLVENAKHGDSAAFAEIYSFYAEDLFRFALYMLGSREDAEDAVQDAVLSAWKNINSLRDNGLFKAWMFKILSNRCKNTLVSKSKAPDALPEDYELPCDGDGFIFERSELSQALSELTPPDGQIVLMSVIGGFSSSELARIYNMPPGTVRSKQKRALEKLKAFLS